MPPNPWEKVGIPKAFPQSAPTQDQPRSDIPVDTQASVDTQPQDQPQATNPWANVGVPKSQPAPQQATSQPNPWAGVGTPKTQAGPGAPGMVRERDDNPFLQSVVKLFHGPSMVELYDKLATHLPDQYKGYAGRLSIELLRAFPEIADVGFSPAGIAMAIAHAYPPLRPAALVVDAGLGMLQAGQAISSIGNAIKDPGPEHVGEAIKDALFTLGLVKGVGSKAMEMGRGADNAAEAKVALQKLKDLAPEKGDNKAVRDYKKGQQDAIWKDLNTPASPMEALYQKLHSSNITGGFAKAFVPPPRNVALARELVMDQESRTSWEKWQTKKYLDDLKATTTADDRDVTKMGYVIQDSATADDVGLSDEGRIAAEKYRNFNEDTVNYLKDAYGDIHIPLQNARTYLSQMWDFSKMEAEPGKLNRNVIDNTARRMMRDPFMKSRNIIKEGDGPIDYKDAIENYGWVPKFNDVADIIEHRMNYLTQAAENQRTAKTLYDIGAIMTPQKAAIKGLSWPQAVDATALYRATYSGSEGPKSRVNRQTGAITVERTVTLERKPVVVAPYIKPAVDALFSPGWATSEIGPDGLPRTTPFGAAETVRAFSKQTQVMGSMFHHFAESSQGMAIHMGHGEPIKAIKSLFVFNPEYGRGVRSGFWKMAGKTSGDVPPVMRLDGGVAKEYLLEARMNLNTSDNEEALVKTLKQFNGNIIITKAMQPAVRKAGDAAQMFNTSLFDYYIQGLMISSYETIKTKELARLGPMATAAEILNLKQNIGAHVNRVYGTESMQSLLIHPKTRQAMAFALFAPVWTLTNARMMTAGWENETQRRLRNKWFGGAALSLFLGTNLMNYATTSWFSRDKDGNHDWKGHFAFSNPGLPAKIFGRTGPVSENASKIYSGPNIDGAPSYISLGKGEREWFGWVTDPMGMFAGKMHGLLKAAMAVYTGVAPGTDYRVVTPASEGSTLAERNTQRGFAVADPFTPFMLEYKKRQLEHALIPKVTPKPTPVQSTFFNVPIGLPAARGVTFTNAAEAYHEYVVKGDFENARRVLEGAAANGIRVDRVIARHREMESQRRSTERGRPLVVLPGSTPSPPK